MGLGFSRIGKFWSKIFLAENFRIGHPGVPAIFLGRNFKNFLAKIFKIFRQDFAADLHVNSGEFLKIFS